MEGGTSQDIKRKQARGTYSESLEILEGGISQDMERKQLGKGHSRSRDGRERDKSGHGKKATEQEKLTLFWGWQRGKQVRT